MQVAAKKVKLPHIITDLPGPKASEIVERDHRVVSPSYTRDYPLVAKSGRGAHHFRRRRKRIPRFRGGYRRGRNGALPS